MSDYKKVFIDRLKQARKAKGLTQRQLGAILAPDNVRAVEAWEYGSRMPTYDRMIKLADELEVSIDWLLGRV